MPLEFKHGHPPRKNHPYLQALPGIEVYQASQQFQAMMIDDDEALQVMGENNARFTLLHGLQCLSPIKPVSSRNLWSDKLLRALALNSHTRWLAEEAGFEFVNTNEGNKVDPIAYHKKDVAIKCGRCRRWMRRDPSKGTRSYTERMPVPNANVCKPCFESSGSLGMFETRRIKEGR